MKKLIIIFLLMSSAGICRADYEFRLNDGATLTWREYSVEGDQYCTQEVKGQSMLGEDDFVDRFADHLKKHKDIPEIPKSRRYANRPALAFTPRLMQIVR